MHLIQWHFDISLLWKTAYLYSLCYTDALPINRLFKTWNESQSLDVTCGISPPGTNQNGIADSPSLTSTESSLASHRPQWHVSQGPQDCRGSAPVGLEFGCLLSIWNSFYLILNLSLFPITLFHFFIQQIFIGYFFVSGRALKWRDFYSSGLNRTIPFFRGPYVVLDQTDNKLVSNIIKVSTEDFGIRAEWVVREVAAKKPDGPGGQQRPLQCGIWLKIHVCGTMCHLPIICFIHSYVLCALCCKAHSLVLYLDSIVTRCYPHGLTV